MVLPVFKALPETAAIPDYSPWRPDHAAAAPKDSFINSPQSIRRVRHVLWGHIFRGTHTGLI